MSLGPAGLLERLLGRLPIGWLQLRHNRLRLFAAVAGVSFADLLILMQLGFLGALLESIALPYRALDGDILLSASDANTLTDGSQLPRQRMYQALAVPGVASAEPVFLGALAWKRPDGSTQSLEAIGVDPSGRAFLTPDIRSRLDDLTRLDTALVDRGTRNLSPETAALLDAGQPIVFETRGRTLTVLDDFEVGGGFTADGYLVVSDQTFLALFPTRSAGAPDHVLLRLEPGADRDAVLAELGRVLPAYDTKVRSIEDAIAADQSYQLTQRPVGLIFGFGVAMGVLVGVIILYQVLSTDVADHLKEYATFKAMGYPQRFFHGIVLEEAAILAVLGFVPALVLATALYGAVAAAATLPLAMTGTRAAGVLLGTVAMATASGMLATRRLSRADPAELF